MCVFARGSFQLKFNLPKLHRVCASIVCFYMKFSEIWDVCRVEPEGPQSDGIAGPSAVVQRAVARNHGDALVIIWTIRSERPQLPFISTACEAKSPKHHKNSCQVVTYSLRCRSWTMNG